MMIGSNSEAPEDAKAVRNITHGIVQTTKVLVRSRMSGISRPDSIEIEHLRAQ